MNRIRRQCSILAAALIVALGLVCTMPTISHAASVKKVKAATTYQKAPALQTGRNQVSNASVYRYVKYTAKKSGTYVFSFSQFRSVPAKNPDANLGFVTVSKLVKNGSSHTVNNTVVKTNKGHSKFLYVSTKYSYNRYYKQKGSGTSNYLYTRTATVKMKKGQTLYFKTYFTNARHSYAVTVKRK